MQFTTVNKTARTGNALALCFFHMTVVAYRFAHGFITQSVMRISIFWGRKYKFFL